MTCLVKDEEHNIFVSEDGRVFKEVGQWNDKDGYKYVTVNRKNLPVHRLVAMHFVSGRTEKARIVCHKDDNPANNTASNLEWGSYSKNNYDAYARGLKTRNIRVLCVETGQTFHSARDAANKMFGIPKRGDHILDAIRNLRGSAYGYHWEVIE